MVFQKVLTILDDSILCNTSLSMENMLNNFYHLVVNHEQLVNK